MATKIYTAYDFTPGQVVHVSRKVLSGLAGATGRVTQVDTEANEVNVVGTVADGKGGYTQKVVTFSPTWLTPAEPVTLERNEIGRWVTLVGQDGTTRPVTLIGHGTNGSALYIEGHISVQVTDADSIAITN